MEGSGSVEVVELGPERLGELAGVLARAMCDNPLHVAAFGDDPVMRERLLGRMFEALMPSAGAAPLGALRDGRLIGACGMVAPGRCRPGRWERARLTPRLVKSLGPMTASRVGMWLSAWESGDPPGRHWHAGPLGVLEPHRGSGVGTALVAAALARAGQDRAVVGVTDSERAATWLEGVGFRVSRQAPALGVNCWFLEHGIL